MITLPLLSAVLNSINTIAESKNAGTVAGPFLHEQL